jgi:GMP synthase-like glutamine amidotransferase
MEILVIDLHIGRDSKETVKIADALGKYVNTHLARLFSPDFNLKDLTNYDGVVISGSDNRKIYDQPKLKGLGYQLKRLSESRKNVLGICGGNQVLASAFSYDRSLLQEPEVGWHHIHITEIGMEDPLFKGVENDFMAFEYHILSVQCNDKRKILT